MSQLVQRVLYKVCTKCTGFVKGHLSPPPNVYLKEFKKKFSDDLGENTNKVLSTCCLAQAAWIQIN